MLTAACSGLRWLSRPLGAADNVWNKPLADNAALTGEPHDLAAQAQSTLAPTINTNLYGAPIVVTEALAVPVLLVSEANTEETNPGKYALKQMLLEGVPIPAGWKPSGDSDSAACFFKPSADKLWEMWRVSRRSDGQWICHHGGRMTGVSTSPGYYQQRNRDGASRMWPYLPTDPVKRDAFEESWWGVTATSLPLLFGAITVEDLAYGSIEHALGIACLPTSTRDGFRAPAQRGDGKTLGAPTQEGMRYRLAANYAIPATLHPVAQLIARAAQKYGLIQWDQAGALSLRGQPGIESYFGAGKYGYDVLKGFPWEQLQVLA